MLPAKRGTCTPAWQSGSVGVLSIFNEGLLVEVLRAAKAVGVLAPLATSSRRLCTLARSGVPLRLSVHGPEQARLVLQSEAQGRPPFSSCTELHLSANDSTNCLLVAGVLSTAQRWTALRSLHLAVALRAQALGPGQSMDICVSSLLSALPALQQLQALELILPSLGPCSAGHIGRLVQLTRLELHVCCATATAAAAAAEAATRLDLGSWSGLTNLKELALGGVAAPQPAASPAGPFCLPSSLTNMSWAYDADPRPGPLACLVTHLPGCPQLQILEMNYGLQQHASTHPRTLVRLLARCNQQLRELHLYHAGSVSPVWGAAVGGLPDDAAAPAGAEWHPGPALAALQGLEVLDGDCLLTIKEKAHWQHLAQLPALTKLVWVEFLYAPPQPAGTTLAVLDLAGCPVHLGGHDFGCLLLACPQLQTAVVYLLPVATTPAQLQRAQLQPHPRLRALSVHSCFAWGQTAATAAAAAAAAASPTAAAGQFGALAPVLQAVSLVGLYGWPRSSRSSSIRHARGMLPDLAPCTSLTALTFSSHAEHPDPTPLEQEDLICMVGPLAQLQRLHVENASRLNARAVPLLQHVLPQLRCVQLVHCGSQAPLLPPGSLQHEEQQACEKVKELLRPGLTLEVIP